MTNIKQKHNISIGLYHLREFLSEIGINEDISSEYKAAKIVDKYSLKLSEELQERGYSYIQPYNVKKELFKILQIDFKEGFKGFNIKNLAQNITKEKLIKFINQIIKYKSEINFEGEVNTIFDWEMFILKNKKIIYKAFKEQFKLDKTFIENDNFNFKIEFKKLIWNKL